MVSAALAAENFYLTAGFTATFKAPMAVVQDAAS